MSFHDKNIQQTKNKQELPQTGKEYLPKKKNNPKSTSYLMAED